jgi:predicted O-methyltransferase YrrM
MGFQHQTQFAKKYLRYYFTAGNRHDVHSPFVYALIENVLRSREQPSVFKEVEALRRELQASKEVLQITDLGAGSLTGAGSTRKVRDIARHAAKPPKFGQLFYRLVQYLQPECMLELGTSLGLSSAYMALAKPDAQVITIEGCPNIAARAHRNFEVLDIHNVQQLTGNFDDVLPALLQNQPRLDWVFIDGNHRKEPTLSYFEQCLTRSHEDSIFIFDDIHWTPGMEEAWRQIRQHPAVTLTIDLFFIGLVFFKPEFKIKQHFVLKY